MDKVYSLEEIKGIAVPIAMSYGVKKLAIFGSYARGEQSVESDLDFVIDKGEIFGWDYFSFADELEQAFHLPVDLMTYNAMKKSFVSDAIKDEVVLYEKY